MTNVFYSVILNKKEAKRKGKYMKYTVSYDSEELINEVTQDVLEFGSDLPVFAIYSWFEEYQVEFVTDYLFADEPERIVDGYWSEEDEEDYQKERKENEDSLKTLEMTKHKKMPIGELLDILVKQNEIF